MMIEGMSMNAFLLTGIDMPQTTDTRSSFHLCIASKTYHHHQYPSLPGLDNHSVSVRLYGRVYCTDSDLHASVTVSKGYGKLSALHFISALTAQLTTTAIRTPLQFL